jgi:hypothetical protein
MTTRMPEVGTPEARGLECTKLGDAVICGELLDEPVSEPEELEESAPVVPGELVDPGDEGGEE